MQFKLFTKLVEELRDASDDLNEQFARDEALADEQLERRAAEAAMEHEASTGGGQTWLLLPRFLLYRQSLLTTNATLIAALQGGREIPLAAERLVNNFHLVEEQLQNIGQRLTSRYYRDLPRLKDGVLASQPRIYAVALSLITHTNGRLDTQTVKCFLDAYQRTAPLTIREVRALELTLRIVLVEKLGRMAARIAGVQTEREAADALADRLLDPAGERPSPDALFTTSDEGKQPKLACVARLVHRLRERNSEGLAALEWLNRCLQGMGQSAETVMRLEQERQSATLAAVDHVIAGMVSHSMLDWHGLFRSISVVDTILSEDPAQVYSSMDLVTQDGYRRVIERIAMRTERSEVEVARSAVGLASGKHDVGPPERVHVGYYLIDGGLPELEKASNYHPSLAELAARVARRHPTFTYLLALAIITATLVAGCVAYALRSGGGLPTLIGVSLLSLIPASEIASVGLRLGLMQVFRPRLLPKMETSSGLPNDAVTMVVVPTVFSSESAVRESLETIEAHYLANQDGNIFFALLGDWGAAPQEEMPGDGALLTAAVNGVRELNARYSDGPQDRFHLFHRRRLWNESEGEWIGWEKKRGKLREFNLLLRGARDTSYTTCTADPNLLERIQYVISLDSDTQMPRDAARKLVGTILHPLNRPRLDAGTNRVTRGYGILQPLVSTPPPRARRSRVPRILSGYHGTTPYTNPVAVAAPNAYQDLFGEGNYVGKALYDVDTFEAALRDRVPQNSLLSHDLLEGLYARTALVADVEIFDHAPSHYVAHSKRGQRWTRGDWQLLPWLLPHVRDARGAHTRNVLSVIGRWKILDNLRRSLIPPAILLWLVAAWTVLPGSPASWTGLILLMFAVPVYLHFTAELLVHLDRNRQAAFMPNAWAVVKISTSQTLFSIAYLAHQAYLMVDAIMRTLYRLLISRKHLLQWTTAAQTQEESTLSPRLFVGYMWPAMAMALTAGVALMVAGRERTLLPAAPLLLAWYFSPLFASWRSRQMQKGFDALEESIERDIRLSARYTWRFFENSFADGQAPGECLTEPEQTTVLDAMATGLGRQLLWTMAAYELGALGTLELAEQLESRLARMENLHVSRGSRCNPGLHTSGMSTPQHVLVSETGNLVGFIRGLKQRSIELTYQPLFEDRLIRGVTDTLLLMKNEFLSVNSVTPRGEGDVILNYLNDEIEMCLAFLRAAGREEAPQTITAWQRFFNTLGQRAAVFEFMLDEFVQKCPAIHVEGLRSWTTYLAHQARASKSELYWFAPWVSVRTAHIAPLIRSHCAPAVDLWNRIAEGLNRPSVISGLAEKSELLLVQLAGLRAQLDQSLSPDTVEHGKALKGCDELRGAIEDALRASNDARSRYERLANRCQVAADATDFSSLFDEEYRLLRSRFQISMVG
ncbi:MAG TPA: hypothetical protein VKC61_24385 [Pyrinomonadaceae bacterium]|nr:hypothetical protein [Pyrinomonadaceae bacterium]